MADFRRPGCHHDIRKGARRHDLALAGHHGQVRHALGLHDVVFRTGQRQVDTLALNGDFRHPDTVIVGIDGKAQIAGRDAIVRQQGAVGDHAYFRRAKRQGRLGTYLCAFLLGKGLADLEEGFLGDLGQFFQLATGNIQID